MNVQKSIKSAWIDFIVCLIFGAYGVHKFREKKIGIGVLYLFTFGLFFFGWLYDCAKLLVIAVCITLQHTKTNDSSSTEEQGEIWNRYNALAKKIALIVVIVFLLFFFIVAACAPNAEPTAIPTTESTTASTTESTTVPTTEPTTAPTTEPTTAPTTEPPHTHSFSSATCTAPKTCSCGATEGEANGHNWKDATCSDPKTCTVCGTTSGLTAGHNFYNGKCTTCGKADPDYNHETLVWIPTNGGTKYHTHAGCSNMKNPEQVTQSEAESRGFTPCKRCH